MNLSRRQLLAAVGVGASTAGCLRLQQSSASVDPTEWVVHPGVVLYPKYESAEWSHVRNPERYAPFAVLRPQALSDVISTATGQRLVERLFDPTDTNLVGVLDADLVVRGPRYATAFGLDTSEVRETLEAEGFGELLTTESGSTVYAVEASQALPAVGIGSDHVSVGRPAAVNGPHLPTQYASDVTSSGTLETHVSAVPALGEAVDAHDEPAYLLVVPTAVPEETDPANGIFADEVVYSVGVTVEDDTATVTVARVFRSDAPPENAIRTWVAEGPAPVSGDASIERDGRVVTASEEYAPYDLTLETLSGQCRNAHDRHLPAIDGAYREVTDGEYETVVNASTDGYEPFVEPSWVLPESGYLTMHFAAENTIQAPAVEGLGVRTLAVPGEVTTVRSELHSGVHEFLPGGVSAGSVSPAGELLVAGDGDQWTVWTGRDQVAVSIGTDDGPDIVPEEVVLSTGTTVRFEWQSPGHTLVVNEQPEDADWEGHPTEEDTGFVHEHTFETAGVYEVACEPHLELGSEATFDVREVE